MANWFDSVLNTASKVTADLSKSISDSTSEIVKNIQGFLPFSDDEIVSLFAVLFAVAAVDGEIDEAELSLIWASPEIDKLSADGKKKIQAYSCKPPSVEEAIKKLSNAKEELKFGLMFYILNLVRADSVISPAEEEAIKIAQREFEINNVQLKAIEDFIEVLGRKQDIQSQESFEEVNFAIERMKKVNIPIKALAHSQDGAEGAIEYSDDQFLEKIKNFGFQAGKGLVEQAFVIWNTLHDDDTPQSAKLILGGALAYLILPVDMVPDFLPVVGLTDDMSAITTALATVAMSITPYAKAKAKEQTDAFFGGRGLPDSVGNQYKLTSESSE